MIRLTLGPASVRMRSMISNVAPQPPRTWTILGHIDATSSDLEPYEMQRLDTLESTSKQDANVVMEVRHQRSSKTRKIVQNVLLAALAPAAALGGVVLGTAMLASGAGVLPSLLLGGALVANTVPLAIASKRAIQHLKRLKHEPQTPGTDWKGTRTYWMGQDSVPGLQSPIVAESKSTKAPSGEALGKFLAENMRQFPAQRYAFILGGHGRARDGVGDVSVADMAKATEIAHASSGRKIDVMVLDSCLVGNFETLLPMSDHVRYAVVSQEPLYTNVIDWSSIVNGLDGHGPSAKRFAGLALHYAKNSYSPHTVATVRMSQMPSLRKAVDTLGEAIAAGVRNGHRDSIAAAFKEAAPIQDSSWLERKTEGKVDMGDLLERLRHVTDPSVRQAGEVAYFWYLRSVVGNVTSKKFSRSTGMRIQGPRAWHRENAYAKETGLAGWSKALSAMRPWPLRMMSA